MNSIKNIICLSSKTYMYINYIGCRKDCFSKDLYLRINKFEIETKYTSLNGILTLLTTVSFLLFLFSFSSSQLFKKGNSVS